MSPISARTAKTGVIEADATLDAGSAALPIHWSTATPTLSMTHIVRIDPTRTYPHGRRRQSQTAATAIRGGQNGRSRKKTGWGTTPVPPSHDGGVLLNTEGTTLRSLTRSFNAKMTRA